MLFYHQELRIRLFRRPGRHRRAASTVVCTTRHFSILSANDMPALAGLVDGNRMPAASPGSPAGGGSATCR